MGRHEKRGTMMEGTRVDAIRMAVAALNDGDIDGYLGFFDPACKRWVAGLDQPLSLAAVREGLAQLRGGFEGLRLNAEAIFGDDNFVCARWKMVGLHARDYMGIAPTGRSICTETCEVYKFQGAAVSESWAYGNIADIFNQIG